MTRRQLEQVRRIALALPGVSERVSHGAVCFFVADRIALCYFHHNHGGDGRVSLWRPAPPGVSEELVTMEPERFFRPSTSAAGTFAHWVGVFLDMAPNTPDDWTEVAAMLDESFRFVAPRHLIRKLEESGHP